MSDEITPDEPATPATVAAVVNPTDAPKPTETVEFWKQKAREQENRAKSNATAAQELESIRESQKTEAQKLADATAKARRDADEARAETTRYKVAATHGVTADYFDLLGSGDEETVSARAERLAPLLSAAAENVQLKAELEALRAGKPGTASVRPVAALKPGASPDNAQTEGDLIYQSLYGTN